MTKKTNQHEDPEVQIENAISKGENFIEKNGKNMLIALCAIVVLIGAYFAYTHLYKAPQESKASKIVYVAQQFFAQGEFEKALNGDGNNAGFLEVIKEYGSTATGNIANHYAGICYLKTGDFEKAIASFEKYTSVKGAAASVINAQNKGLIGDAYSELKNNNKAVTFYEKAVAESDNELTAPYYLMKAGSVYEVLGNNSKALECYEKIKTTYFQSMEAREIDKYIGRLTK